MAPAGFSPVGLGPHSSGTRIYEVYTYYGCVGWAVQFGRFKAVCRRGFRVRPELLKECKKAAKSI